MKRLVPQTRASCFIFIVKLLLFCGLINSLWASVTSLQLSN